ncbi:hypothetical protein, partial [Priestia megaterium]|uniref:hypothetical protein n=1 Tax=Priestia megaterium TaxID=1404 RepID=UPI0035B598F4
ERKAFRYPFMKGLTAQEVEPSSKAAGEVRRLFDALCIPTVTPAHRNTGTHVHRRNSDKARMRSGEKV